MNYKLSNQAVGAIMLALQKGILEQSDITNILKDFDILNSADGLIVNNPPTISLAEKTKEKVTKKRTRRKKVNSKTKKEKNEQK